MEEVQDDKVLVLIPCYNEGESLRKVEKDLRTNFPEAEILFINDHSTDHSLEVIKDFENIHYLDLPLNLGYFYAIQAGFKYASNHDYEYIVQFDGDGQHLAKEAKKLYDVAKANHYDVTIGSRFKEKTEYKHTFLRRIATRYFQKILKWTTGEDVTDPTSGLQVLSRDVFTHLAESENFPATADANLLMELSYKGYSLHEEPVIMESRENGKGMYKGLIDPALYMIKMTYSMILVYLEYFTKKKKKHDG